MRTLFFVVGAAAILVAVVPAEIVADIALMWWDIRDEPGRGVLLSIGDRFWTPEETFVVFGGAAVASFALGVACFALAVRMRRRDG